MSAAPAAAKVPAADGAAADVGAAKGGKKKLILIAAPVLLIAILAGLWFSGILPSLLGMGKNAEHADEAAEAKPDAHAAKPDAHGAKPDAKGAKPDAKAAKLAEGAGTKPDAKALPGPMFAELPDIVTNLNAGPRRTVYVKLRSRLELAKPEDAALVTAAMPRLLDLFQTYLREMRPEELRGSAGTYRLREELLARANIAVAPARVQDLLFTEMLIQ